MKLEKTHHYLLPPDSSRLEEQILNECIIRIYEKLTDPTDKFLVAFVFEVGYSKNTAANALGVTPQTISRRIKNIKKKLATGYNISIEK